MTQQSEIEEIARAIWHAQWEDAWPREGGIEHAHALEVARAAYEVMARSDGWLPIETAPKDGTKRLLYFPAIPALVGRDEHIGISEDNGGPFRHPTHWRPLPDPPSSIRELPHD